VTHSVLRSGTARWFWRWVSESYFRQLVVAAALLLSVPLLAVIVSGNEHARDRDKGWVMVLSWISAASFYALVALGLVAILRARKRRAFDSAEKSER
jgi:NADH:ubiquinone oxidoreductase subunit K